MREASHGSDHPTSMTADHAPPLAASRKRSAGFYAILCALIGGVVMATLDLIACQRGMALAQSFASSFSGKASAARTSVTWLGFIDLGEVDHPYLWIGSGGFLIGAAGGAVGFLVVY